MRGAPEPTITGTDPQECFEKQVTTTMAGALFSVLSRLPATWRARRRARRIAASLPDYSHTVPLPDSDTLYAWLEELCVTPHRRPGTPEGRRAEQWVAGKLRGFGVEDVREDPLPMTAGLWIGRHDGNRLRQHAKAGATATLTLEGQMEPGTTHNVWGVLPGQSEEVILVTSHHDSPFLGVTEDGAGVVQVLAQAQAWARVPREQRPKTLVFVVDAGHFYGSIGARNFAQTHRDLLEKTRILLTLEHLAARDVEVQGEHYADTGKLALTVMFTTPDPTVIATVIKALERKPARVTASIPSNFFGPVPTSDAMGYVMATSVPVISWIGCPYYLLDAQDTLDKIAKEELGPICETVTELVKIHMVLP